MRNILALLASLLLALSYAPALGEEAALVSLPAGSFSMGSPEDEPWRSADETLHTVTVSAFSISPYEVTQSEYEALMGENPSTFRGENLPVEGVSWYDAIAYCNARSAAEGLTPAYTVDGSRVTWDLSSDGYRLPTEAEWEYACRAGTVTPFNTQTSISVDGANYWGHYPYQIEENYFSQENLETKPGIYREETVPVGSFAPNAWGLYDMHGNVSEWVWDAYGNYAQADAANPTGPEAGPQRIYRGGAWNDFAKNLRSAYRAAMQPELAAFNVGLRVARGAVAAQGSVTMTGEETDASGSGDTLIAYFSWGGNTRGIAEEIQRQTGFDLFEIICVTPYSDVETNTFTQPHYHLMCYNTPYLDKLAAQVEGMERYGTIILGYPNWWASIPMPVATFLESYDFAGKTILPFCSHGGGRFGQSLTAIAKLVPDATLLDGLAVSYSGGSRLSEDVAQWLSQSGVLSAENE